MQSPDIILRPGSSTALWLHGRTSQNIHFWVSLIFSAMLVLISGNATGPNQYQEATLKYFKLCCAKEEITHLNIKICQLCTLIHDEAISVANVINKLQQSNWMLAQELHQQYCSHLAINAIHINRLDCIKSHPDFSGIRGVGV